MASIEKRETKNGEDRFVITVSNGYRIDGSKIREKRAVTLPADMSEKQKNKEINRIAYEFEQTVKNGLYLDGNKITLKQFVDKWEKIVTEAGTYAPSTWHIYHQRIHNRILPSLGHLKINKIRAHHILIFINNLRAGKVNNLAYYIPTKKMLKLLSAKSITYKSLGISNHIFSKLRKGEKTTQEYAVKVASYFNLPLSQAFTIEHVPLSNRTVKHHIDLLSTIFTAAVHWQVIEKNPVENIEPIKVKKKEIEILEGDDLLKFFTALETAPMKYKVAIYLAFDIGLRLSEVMGLCWEHLNEDNHTIKVEKARQHIANFGEVIKGPKTDSGTRSATLSDTVFAILIEYKEFQEENKRKYNDIWEDYEHIITHENGQKMSATGPSSWLTNFLRQNNLRHITFHGLRHSNASFLVSQNIDLPTLAKRLGHSDTKFTLSTYVHPIQSKDKQAANIMDSIYEQTD